MKIILVNIRRFLDLSQGFLWRFHIVWSSSMNITDLLNEQYENT